MARRFKEEDKTLKAVMSGLKTAKEIHQADDERDTITELAVTQRLRRLWKKGLLKRVAGPSSARGRGYYIYTPTAKAERLTSNKKEPNGRRTTAGR